MNLAIDKPSRSDQFMVTRCVMRQLAGLCTTELQGTTGCHRKLMKIARGNEERKRLATRPQADVAGSLATS
jgi:hypothetical protein